MWAAGTESWTRYDGFGANVAKQRRGGPKLQEVNNSMERTPTDLLAVLLEMRSGLVAADLNAKFNEVLGAVLDNAGKGELTIKLSFAPSRLAMGGAVIEIEALHSTTLKKPENKIGKSAFFVGANGQLSRDNPDQVAMFGESNPQRKEKK